MNSHGRTSPSLKWKRVALRSSARDVEDDQTLPSTPKPPKAPVLPSRKPAAGAKSNRSEECGGECEQWFAAIAGTSCGSFEPCGPQPWPAQARKHPAGTGHAPQAAPEIIHNAFSCKTFARAGCGGRAFSASRPRAQGLPYQKEPAGYACHNCELCILHFELFPAPRQTGISNWRQRGEVERKGVRGGRGLQR
jgi:hypothetical protein